MFKLLSYLTPSQFAASFAIYAQNENFKQVRILSLLGFGMALLSRLVSLLYLPDFSIYPNYNGMSAINWVAFLGHFLFFSLSFLKIQHRLFKVVLSNSFVVFVIGLGLAFSYTISMHDTKNTLMMLLLSVMVASVFFILERRIIFTLTIGLLSTYWLTIVMGKISVYDKVLNIAAGLMVSSLLLVCSRFTYFFRSQYFVKVQELEEKNKRIEFLSNQKNEVLAYVVHDLRSPLANIEMLNEFILTDQPNLHEAQLIKQSSDQANHIINDLLDALRHDSVDETSPKVDVSALMAELVVKWQKSGGRIIHLASSIEPILAQCNRSKLERVFENLFQNAHKFSPLEKPVEISVVADMKHVRIQFRDFGMGIPNQLITCLFDQFTPASRKGLRGEKSTGIGLHISKKIVEQYQGSLTVQSEENVGSTFVVQLLVA